MKKLIDFTLVVAFMAIAALAALFLLTFHRREEEA